MRKRKLFQLLSLMSADDLNAFQHFLESPLFNNSKTLLRFFGTWREKVLDTRGQDVDETEDLTVEAFLEGTDIQPGRMDKLSSQLRAKVQEFLAFQAYRAHPLLQKEMFLTAVQERALPYEDLKRLHRQLDQQAEKAPDSPELRMHRVNLKCTLASASIRTRQTQAVWREDFREIHHLIDRYHELHKLKYTSATVNARQVFNHEDRDAQTFLQTLEASGQADDLPPLARGYYLTIRMLSADHDGTPYFEQLLATLTAHATTFSRDDAKDLYWFAINFCIRNSNAGRTDYLAHMSGLYLQLLDNGLLLEAGKLNPQQFKNIVSLHCRLGKLDWVRTFIDDNGTLLPAESAENALRYNEAVLSFHQKDYPKAISQLKEMIALLKDDVFYGLDARVYLWKSYFEHLDHLSMDEVDEMYRLYDAFRVFTVRNDKISPTHKQAYQNFIREFKRFMEILSVGKEGKGEKAFRASLSTLREELLALEYIANKSWFLAKVDAELAR